MCVRLFASLGSVLLIVLTSRGNLAGQDDPKEVAMQLVAKAQESAKANEFNAAVALMHKALALTPDNDSYLAMTSEFELKAYKFADGFKHALEAIKLNDRFGSYYLLAATNALWNQDIELAREYCTVVLRRGVKDFGQAAYRDAKILDAELRNKTFTLFWTLDPQKVRSASSGVAIALPKTGLPGQHVTYGIGGVKSQRLVKGDVNDVLHIVPQSNKPCALTVKVALQPYGFKKELSKADWKPPTKEALANLGPLFAVDPKSPTLKKLGAELKGKDKVATARNILAWMKKNIEYKYDSKSIDKLDFKTVDEIVKRGHAECRGHTLLFVGLCRATDLPARPIWGLLRVPPGADRQFGDIVSHNWAEILIGGSWVPVDPQRPETLGLLPTNYVRMFMDARKSDVSTETLPVLNLIYMQDGKITFEESK